MIGSELSSAAKPAVALASAATAADMMSLVFIFTPCWLGQTRPDHAGVSRVKYVKPKMNF